MPRTTLADVAASAGVSVATASRALSSRGDLSVDTRRSVLAAADALGYSRRSTDRGRPPSLDPRSIELVVGKFDDAWNDEVIVGARRAAVEVGCDLILTLERNDPADDWPERVAVRRSSGVILALINPTRAQLERLAGLTIPVVLLEPHGSPTQGLPSVTATNEAGGASAAHHLADCGYERFVLVTGQPPYRFGRARERGFREALRERIPDADIAVASTGWGGRLHSSVIEAIVTSDERRVGVFTANDTIAFSVLQAVASRGLRVPQDVGVVGFDDEPGAMTSSPALTTVHQPLRAMAAAAVHMVRDGELRDAAVAAPIELPTRLVVRGSTAPA